MKNFHIQLLSDSEYESLPFRHVKESMGCADPESGMAFIRQTGVPAIDMGTLEHEVNHLIEKHGGESADLDGIGVEVPPPESVLESAQAKISVEPMVVP